MTSWMFLTLHCNWHCMQVEFQIDFVYKIKVKITNKSVFNRLVSKRKSNLTINYFS